MWDVRACRCCLSTGPGLKLLENPFDIYYSILTAIDLYVGDGYPNYICFECKARLQSAYEFQKKCHKAFTKMKNIMSTKHEVTLSNIKKIDRRNFKSGFGMWNASAQHYRTVVASPHLRKENSDQVRNISDEKTIMRINIPSQSSANEHIDTSTVRPSDQDTTHLSETDRIHYSALKDNLFYKSDDGFTLSINEYGYVTELSVETQLLAIKMWTEDEAYKLAKLKCDKCHEIFSSLPALIHHSDKHTTLNTQYQCNICYALFKNKTFLIQHQSDVHLWKIVCKSCGYVCHIVKVFYNHLKAEHKEIMKYSSGSACDNPISSSNIVIQNVIESKDRFEAWPRICVYCNKELANSEEYKSHYKEKHPIKPCTLPFYKLCKTCGKSFTRYKLYYSHLKKAMCVPKKVYKCRECDMKSHELETMFQHLIRKHKEDPHKCQFCPKLYNMDNSCKKHISTLLLRSVEYKCSVCGNVYDIYESLVRHQRKHVAESAPTDVPVANLADDQNLSQIDKMHRKYTKQYHFQNECRSDTDCTSSKKGFSK